MAKNNKNDKKETNSLNFVAVSDRPLYTTSGVAMTDMMDFDTISSGSKWIKWGCDNKFPQHIWDNYLKCSLLSSIINRILDYTYGEGVEVVGNYITSNEDSIEDVIKKCIFDKILFGGFAIECIRNAKGDIVRYNYQNVMNVRTNEALDTAYISKKWTNYSNSNIVELPIYDKTKIQSHFIYFDRGSITRGINPIPSYISALKSIEILNNTRNFHMSNLINGFTAACIINLNNGNIKSRELQEIKDKLTEGYTGSSNAGKFILMNGGDKEHATTIERLNSDSFGDLYMSLDESSKEDLYTAFGINPMLLGKNENSGFAQEEFENAYKLFYFTTIKPIQNDVIKSFAKINVYFNFKNFKINWAD